MVMASLLYPVVAEPLPLYTPRQTPAADPETSSIRSGAPSYVSETPSYHSSPSRRTSTNSERASPVVVNPNEASTDATSTRQHQRIGVSSPESTDGTSRTSTPTGSFAGGAPPNLNGSKHMPPIRHTMSHGSYESTSRRSTISSIRSRTSIAVTIDPSRQANSLRPLAERTGARRSSAYNLTSLENDLFTTASPISPFTPDPNLPTTTEAIPSSTAEASSPPPTAQRAQPISPYEDPELVGQDAAAMARSQRLYISSHRDGRGGYTAEETEAMRKQEANTWDFMISQMADWDKREKNWCRFKTEVERERRGFLGNRGNVRRSRHP